MVEMRGTIEKIWENKTKNGKKYWVISVDGKRYSVWNEELLKGLAVGDAVELSWTGSGRFMNVSKIVKLSVAEDSKAMQIIRMSCLRSAVEFFSGSRRPRLERVLSLAKTFEDYVCNEVRDHG